MTNAIQAAHVRRLFSAVVLSVLDDAVRDNSRYRKGFATKALARWADSKDGHLVLSLAGITPGPNTTKRLVAAVERGPRNKYHGPIGHHGQAQHTERKRA